MSEAEAAVAAALHDHGTVDDPDPRRVLVTVRCTGRPRRHLLARVISTRSGPVWTAKVRVGPGAWQLAEAGRSGVAANPADQWEFRFLNGPDGSLLPARCRCGGGTAMLPGPSIRDALAGGAKSISIDVSNPLPEDTGRLR